MHKPKRHIAISILLTEVGNSATAINIMIHNADISTGTHDILDLWPRAVLVSVCGGQLSQMLGGGRRPKKQFGLVGTAAPGPDFFGRPGGGPGLGPGSGGVLGFI